MTSTMGERQAVTTIDKVFDEWIKLSNDLLSQNNNNNVHRISSEKHQQLSVLSSSLFDLIDSNLSHQMMNAVCQQLIALFRSKERKLRLLVLEFIPSLIWSYLSSVQFSTSKILTGLEACLLTLYNLSLSQSDKDASYITIPSLGRSSVYHEVTSISVNPLTEITLSKYEQDDKKIPVGPFPLVEKLNAKNRLPVLTHLIRCYTKDIGVLSERSHQSLCALSIKVTCTGFKTYLSHRLLPPSSHSTEQNLITRPRIAVSPEFLCEILHGIYFIMFNGQPEMGLEVLECVHQRANYELYPNVILLTNAIKNSLEHNPSGQPYDGPMGVSIAITPAHILSSLNKQAITNASFKTQKLPDDITPEDGEDSPSDTETDMKNVTTASDKGKLLGGITFKPLKSALKRVERSITQKKNVESRDVTHSPKAEKLDKVEAHAKASRQASGGKDKLASTNQHEMTTLPPAIIVSEETEQANGLHDAREVYPAVDHEHIEIIIDPPASEAETSSVTKL